MTNEKWKMENGKWSRLKIATRLVKNTQNILEQSSIGRQPLSRTQIKIAAERRECSARAFQDRGQRGNVVIFQRGGFDHHVSEAPRDQIIAVTISQPAYESHATAQPDDPFAFGAVDQVARIGEQEGRFGESRGF